MKKFVLSTTIILLAIALVNGQDKFLEIKRDINGHITFARFRNSDKHQLKDGQSFLKDNLDSSLDHNLSLIKTESDSYGITHERYQQYFKGVKVEDAQYLLHGRAGIIETMNGTFKSIKLKDVTPKLVKKKHFG